MPTSISGKWTCKPSSCDLQLQASVSGSQHITHSEILANGRLEAAVSHCSGNVSKYRPEECRQTAALVGNDAGVPAYPLSPRESGVHACKGSLQLGC